MCIIFLHIDLTRDARLCLDCVCDECHRIRLMEKITNDHRAITAILKTPCTRSVISYPATFAGFQ